MEINQKIWEHIRGGTFTVKQVIDGVEGSVHFIDWLPIDNDFLVVNQMKSNPRKVSPLYPDLVVY
jgi:type I restriction enzyme R subunit